MPKLPCLGLAPQAETGEVRSYMQVEGTGSGSWGKFSKSQDALLRYPAPKGRNASSWGEPESASVGT